MIFVLNLTLPRLHTMTSNDDEKIYNEPLNVKHHSINGLVVYHIEKLSEWLHVLFGDGD